MILRYIISAILFLPITVSFFLYAVFKHLFLFLNTFHPEHFSKLEIPVEILIHSKGHEFFVKVLIIIFQTFYDLFTELKTARYKL